MVHVYSCMEFLVEIQHGVNIFPQFLNCTVFCNTIIRCCFWDSIWMKGRTRKQSLLILSLLNRNSLTLLLFVLYEAAWQSQTHLCVESTFDLKVVVLNRRYQYVHDAFGNYQLQFCNSWDPKSTGVDPVLLPYVHYFLSFSIYPFSVVGLSLLHSYFSLPIHHKTVLPDNWLHYLSFSWTYR